MNQALKKKKSNQPNDNYKVSLCNHWLLDGVCHFNEDCHFAHGEEEINDRLEKGNIIIVVFIIIIFIIIIITTSITITVVHCKWKSMLLLLWVAVCIMYFVINN